MGAAQIHSRARPGHHQLALADIRCQRGRVVAQAQREFTQYFPQPGWVEHDAREIWESQRATMLEALRAARLAPRDIAAVGITNQRETTVLWDRATGEPVARAIVWQDRRTAAACEQLRAAGLEPEIISAHRPAARSLFFRHQARLAARPRARARAHARSAASWPSAPSTAGCCTSSRRIAVTSPTPPTPAARCCTTCTTGDWDDRLLELFRVPRACLPEIVDSCLPRADARRDRARRRQTTADRHRRRPAGRAVRPGLFHARAWPRTPTAPAASR